MISSTLRIISAASVAESNTACLTLNASEIPRCAISPTCHDINCRQESKLKKQPYGQASNNRVLSKQIETEKHRPCGILIT
jgi:hypothetical protein